MKTLSLLLLPLVMSAAAFQPEKDSALLALAPDSLRTKFSEALVDAGANWPELAQAVRYGAPEQRGEAIWLILAMPHLDRLEMTRGILLEHIEYAHRSTSAFPYRVPDSLFRDYLLAYRIGDEPVTAWRRLLFDRFSPMVRNAATPEQAARVVNQWLARNLGKQRKGFFGPLKSPDLTLTSRNGSQEEISILAAAILKTLGVPSRRAKIPWLGQQNGDTSWVEVFSQGRWLPLYPVDARHFGDYHALESKYPHNVTIVVSSSAFDQALVTERYTPTGLVRLHLASAGRPLAKFENFSFNVFNYGGWQALDELNTVTDSSADYECRLGEGSYRLTCGIRDQQGNPWIVNRELQVEPGDTLVLDLDLTPPPAAGPDTTGRPHLMVWNLPSLDGSIISLSKLTGRPNLIIAVRPSVGSCTAAVLAAEKLHQQYEAKGLAVVGVGQASPDSLRSFVAGHKLTFPFAFVPPDLPEEIAHPDLGSCSRLMLFNKTGEKIWSKDAPSSADLEQLSRAVAGLMR
jgi:hypothetical protein